MPVSKTFVTHIIKMYTEDSYDPQPLFYQRVLFEFYVAATQANAHQLEEADEFHQMEKRIISLWIQDKTDDHTQFMVDYTKTNTLRELIYDLQKFKNDLQLLHDQLNSPLSNPTQEFYGELMINDFTEKKNDPFRLALEDLYPNPPELESGCCVIS